MGRIGRLVLAAGLLATVVGGIGAAPSHGVSKGSSSQSCSRRRVAEAGTTARTLQLDGLERPYLLTIPPRYDGRRAAPLVLNLHGFGGTGEAQNALTDMPTLAAERGYVVVSPDGGPLKVPIGLVP